MSKKWAGLGMVALLSLALAACGSNNSGSNVKNNSSAGGETNQTAQTEAGTTTNHSVNTAANETESTSKAASDTRTIERETEGRHRYRGQIPSYVQ